MSEQSKRDIAPKRCGVGFPDLAGSQEEKEPDQIVPNGNDDGAQIERPLKVVFAGFLALIICALTVQNITTELAILQAPYNHIKAASQDLIHKQKAFLSNALTGISKELSAAPAIGTTVAHGNPGEVAGHVDRIFSRINGETGLSGLTVYRADRTVLYHSGRQRSGVVSSPPDFKTDLANSLFRTTNSLEIDHNGVISVSALRPWVSGGRLTGYLKVRTDIEPSLTLLSSAANGVVLMAGGPLTSGQKYLPSKAYHSLSSLLPLSSGALQKFLQAGTAPDWLLPVYLEDGRLLIAQDLQLEIINGEAGSRLVLMRDITDRVLSFLKSMSVMLLVSISLAVLAWLALQRLVSRLLQTIRATRSKLDAEVTSNTEKLKRSRARLLEAQAIASIGNWDVDIVSKEASGSEEFFRILGIPPETPPTNVLKCLFSKIPESELGMVKSNIRTATDQCGTFDFEHSIHREDGTIGRVHTQGHVTGDENGRPLRGIGTVQDITERSNTERQNKLMAKILETSLNEIYVLNADTFKVEYANACAMDNLGYHKEELKRLKLWDINQDFGEDSVTRTLAPLMSREQTNYSAETIQRRKDGTGYPVDFHIQMVRDQGRNRLVVIANDISERVQRESETRDAKERAERLAYFDPLTKLSNRAGCQRDAKNLFADESKPAFLIHVDMDNFKRVNDTLGHLAGDYCLAETGRRLREVSRGLGTPYRWGGDEFVILASSPDSDPNELCERARRLMRAPMEFNGTTFWPTVSMGIALCPDHGTEFDTLLVNADLALYCSKHSGKDRLTFFSSDLQTLSDKEAEIERELYMAAQRDEFFLVFQPQVNLRSHKVVGMEALVRWQHPERGVVSPGEFLPIVEKTGFASVLGEIVLDKAFAAARSWQDAGLDFGRISVNISPAHLSSGQLLEQFKSALERHQLAPERITAEVLESVFLDDHKSCHLSTLTDLYEMGVHVELDDFGTGYASLTHVVDLPINGLKIDRSFTRQLLEDSRKEIVINQIIHLARSLDISVICEGVETEEQYDRLRMMGDFAVQGFLVAKPLPFEEATDWMAASAEDLYFVF